ncbi:phosphotransferase enzyme family protein [Halosimplex salinum]|uniref:phosphotransferase enzyme family protein n=1 Tax=Halosimplex salinum TaxID=1710538 RepID=UPI000F495D6E|nr:phosphotransferase [Halosimplex salinum]
MPQDVHSALEAFERHEIRAQLHDVPPHAVYEVRVDGRRAVCKVARGETADVGREAVAMDHVDRHTDLPVPTVLAADEDAFVATWLDALAGEETTVDRDDPEDARALGAGLARLHDATAGQFPRPGVPRLGTPWGPGSAGDPDDRLAVETHRDWHALARAVVSAIRDYLVDIGWAGPADEVLALLDDRPDLFDGAGTPVLCHGNVLPEHVAFERSGSGDTVRSDAPLELAALVDFEHALVAPAEYDYWRTAIPCFHTSDLDPRPTLSAFRAGYESVRSLPLGVERRREGWWAVILVTYLLALDVQNGGIGPDERPRARGIAAVAGELADAVRSRRR